MLHIDLTAYEMEIFARHLENEISDIGMEIADTDRYDFREQLKDKRRILQKILTAITQPS